MNAFRRAIEAYRSLFRAPTMTEIVEQQMTAATLEVGQAQHTIMTHEFTLHMARARIAALEAWNHREDAKP